MVDYLIEMIFSNFSAENVGRLLKKLGLNGKNVLSCDVVNSPLTINWNSEKSMEEIFGGTEDLAVFVNLKGLKVDGFFLSNCGVAIYKNTNMINIELNFEISELKRYRRGILAESLMKLARSIAADYHITNYFCGIEPAQDVTTRLFTNERPGPLFYADFLSNVSVEEVILKGILSIVGYVANASLQQKVWVVREGDSHTPFAEIMRQLFDDYDLENVLNDYKTYGISNKQYEILNRFYKVLGRCLDEKMLWVQRIDQGELLQAMAKEVLKAFNYHSDPS
jgi:hypothetical protein